MIKLEQRFLIQLLVGELRQGALTAAMLDAIAKATATSPQLVRRAHMLSGDLAAVARAARQSGNDGLAQFRLVVGQAIESLLAQPADDIEAAVAGFTADGAGVAVLDYKMDGARVQVHKDGADVIVFSRQLNDVTAALPEVDNVIFMAARKFGSTGDEALTWAMNAWLPSQVARRFRNSKIVAFSSGNVYPFVPVSSGGATEETPPAPIGESAQSVLARERMLAPPESVRARLPVVQPEAEADDAQPGAAEGGR